VTAWTPGELAVLTDSGSLSLSAGDDGQPGVETGMVVVGGELYVRAYRGAQSGPADAIDAAYQAKYGNISAVATTPQARSATIL
jgi:hypothetical protein